jgi:hypothetical protein
MCERLSDSGSDNDDEPEIKVRETLRETFRERAIRSAFDKTPHDFVPEGVVQEVVTRDQVQQCLKISSCSTPEHDDLIRFVMAGAKKAFAVAIFAKNDVEKTLKWLRYEDISDQSLPIIKPKKKSWTSGWRGDFLENQWKFFAPTINTAKHSHVFEEAFILPVIKTSVVTGKGSFGEVSCTEVHPGHMKPVRKSKLVALLQLTHNYVEASQQWSVCRQRTQATWQYPGGR